MIASWYDVLGVDDDATADEIRTAWQEAVAGLDPTDRRFKQRNRAAEVLLDPQRRARHDAELAAQEDDDEADDEADAEDAGDTLLVETAQPESDEDPTGRDESAEPGDAADDVAVPESAYGETTGATGGRSSGRGGLVVTVALGLLAVVSVVAVVIALASGGGGGATTASDDGLPDAREVQAARTAAEAAVGPVISYDYRTLDKSRAAAVSFMTPTYAETYEKNFVVIEENAPRTQTIVTAEVLGSGVVRTGEDLVDVLVFVNRPTRNSSTDTVYRDQVTLRMLDLDGRWLVDCLITTSGDSCGE